MQPLGAGVGWCAVTTLMSGRCDFPFHSSITNICWNNTRKTESLCVLSRYVWCWGSRVWWNFIRVFGNAVIVLFTRSLLLGACFKAVTKISQVGPIRALDPESRLVGTWLSQLVGAWGSAKCHRNTLRWKWYHTHSCACSAKAYWLIDWLQDNHGACRSLEGELFMIREELFNKHIIITWWEITRVGMLCETEQWQNLVWWGEGRVEICTSATFFVPVNHLGLLLKCRFPSWDWSWEALEIMFTKLSCDAGPHCGYQWLLLGKDKVKPGFYAHTVCTVPSDSQPPGQRQRDCPTYLTVSFQICRFSWQDISLLWAYYSAHFKTRLCI